MSLSPYAEGLSDEAKMRCKAIIGPFVGVMIGKLCKRMPPMESIDIVSCLFCEPVL